MGNDNHGDQRSGQQAEPKTDSGPDVQPKKDDRSGQNAEPNLGK
jgi:hypothetical protein